MARKPDPSVARQATKDAVVIAAHRAGRTAVAGVLLAVVMMAVLALG